jgi:hypothetical protein
VGRIRGTLSIGSGEDEEILRDEDNNPPSPPFSKGGLGGFVNGLQCEG